jgi:lipoprotein-releasing system ATP-binding protein
MLSLSGVYKEFDQAGKVLQVLRGIDASFQQAKSYAITGVSGSGKSTLLHLLGGIDVPTEGKITFNGKDLETFKANRKQDFLNRSIGFVFQFHYLIKELSVLENVMLMGLIKGDSREKCKSRAKQLLSLVNLSSKADAYPCQLSGGQQQRVAIARALFNKPLFLLADEPTGNLDAENAQQIIDLFVEAQNEWDMGLIICSHDSAVCARMGKVCRLFNGSLLLERE